MKLRELNWWISVRESLWLVPALFVVGALLLAPFMVYLDSNYAAAIDRWFPFAFEGSTEGARLILGTIATSMATIVGVVFSITTVVLQLAAGNYSPRVIVIFRRDRGQQFVLGTYLATFVYAVLVARQVQDAGEGREVFIPGLSMWVALALAVSCLGLLVYFVHHVSEQLRVSDIAHRIHADVMQNGRTLYPEQIGREYDPAYEDAELIARLDEDTENRHRVQSQTSGYLRNVDGDRLSKLLKSPVRAARIWPRMGDFVTVDSPIIDLYFEDGVSKSERAKRTKMARKCLTLGQDLSVAHNPDFGVRQLVDIALRALSPGVNDPTTAEQVLVQLGDWIGQLAGRTIPSSVRGLHGNMLVTPSRDFDARVADAFDQIRRAARTQIHVLECLVEVLTRIVQTDPPTSRLAPLRAQAEAVQRTIQPDYLPDSVERRELSNKVRTLLDTIETKSEAAE
ncbi:DUF2254 domain-containing protein [Bradymonas sediminis]|nr:DUF2254 domain-containing protein [Bradymonas sediminis]TDP73503.1 putative membrane protein [Bradymonas sediminis]